MSVTLEVLDTRIVQSSLDAFLRLVLSSNDASRLKDGQSLLVRLLEAPGRPLDEPQAAELRGWVATRSTEPDGTRSITCWNEDDDQATLLAEWKGASLDWWSVTAGDRSYISRLADPDQATSAGNQKTGPSLGDRARAQFRDWVRSHPRRRSYCPICSFENEERANVCVMCRGAIPVASAAMTNRGEEEIGERTMLIEAPDRSVLNAAQKIEREPIAPAPPAPAPKERVSPIAAPQFEVVLRAFPPQRREAVLVFLREILRDSTRNDRTAQEIIAAMPAVIETRVSIVRARELSDKLRTLEATVEIRRTRS